MELGRLALAWPAEPLLLPLDRGGGAPGELERFGRGSRLPILDIPPERGRRGERGRSSLTAASLDDTSVASGSVSTNKETIVLPVPPKSPVTPAIRALGGVTGIPGQTMAGVGT